MCLLTGVLELKEDRRAGLASFLKLQCSKCDHVTTVPSSTSVTARGTSYDVNGRAVFHAIDSGVGYEGLSSFCAAMNMPLMSKTSYYKHLENILVCEFVRGASYKERVMERLLAPAGKFTKQVSKMKDKKRVHNADLATSQKAKKRRQAISAHRLQREEAIRSSEGTSYESGAF